MLTVHGFWSREHGLCLWGEDSERPVRSNSQATRQARPHPFAIPSDDLAVIHPGKCESVTLLLPSVLTAPLDSPELLRLRPRPEPKRGPAVLPWTLSVVCFDAASAPVALCQTGDDVRYGRSIDYLAQVCDFAAELAERGRVLPTVTSQGEGYAARWRPVLQGADIVAAEALTAAMPPICRSEQTSADNAGQRPTELFAVALGALVNAEVRRHLVDITVEDLVPPRRGRPPAKTPVAEAWASALTGTDGRFEAGPADIEELRAALAHWADVGVGRTGPARATFRLTDAPPEDTPKSADPTTSEQRWRLELLLQSVEDPSLLVPASQVWTAGEGLGRWLSRPDELLLTELGRASAIYPNLSGALPKARPESLDLDGEGAYEFLSTWAGHLDQAGFGVLVPSWWDKRSRLGLKATASTPRDQSGAGGFFSQESLYEFEWTIALGDESLTRAELETLAAAKTHLVRLRGEWVAIDPEQLRKGLEFLGR